MRRALLAAAVLVAASVAYFAIRDVGRGYSSTDGATLVHFTLHSRLANADLHETLVRPAHRGSRTLVVLLHGRGSKPDSFLSQQFFDGLAALGGHAPYVLLLDGGDHSYWHDRSDGRWGSMVLREAIPAGVARTHAKQVAIGGISMGGFGALDLGGRGTFCAVGAHSAALWFAGGDTAPGAFDDAEDFARHDLIARPPTYRAPVWMDVGSSDPFFAADTALARKLGVKLRVWPGGGHGGWQHHMALYLRFYADACG
jgi:poly(3-hydroxybutyrate) depolymerase